MYIRLSSPPVRFVTRVGGLYKKNEDNSDRLNHNKAERTSEAPVNGQVGWGISGKSMEVEILRIGVRDWRRVNNRCVNKDIQRSETPLYALGRCDTYGETINKDLNMNLCMRLYKSSVCNILTYGSEVWRLKPKVWASLNVANSIMVSILTDREVREEATECRGNVRPTKVDQRQKTTMTWAHVSDRHRPKGTTNRISNAQDTTSRRHVGGRSDD